MFIIRKLRQSSCRFLTKLVVAIGFLGVWSCAASAAVTTVTSNIENGGTHTHTLTDIKDVVVQRFKTGKFHNYEIENIWVVHKKKGDGTCPVFQVWIWTTPDASTRRTIGIFPYWEKGVTKKVDKGTEDCVRKYKMKNNNSPRGPLQLSGDTDYYMAMSLRHVADTLINVRLSLTTWTESDSERNWEQDNKIGTGSNASGNTTFRAKNSGALRFRIEETNTPPQFVGESNKDLGFSTSAGEKYSCGIAKGFALQTAPWEITVREHLAMGDRLCDVNVYDADKGDKLTLSVSEGYFWVFGDLVYGSSRDSERTVDLDRSKSTNLSVHGELIIRKPFDYEDPAFTNNIRFITLTVSDGRHTVTQTLTVKLVDEPDFPEDFYYSPVITPGSVRRETEWPVQMEWVSPWNPSRPDVTHYNVRYREDGTNDAWKYIKGIVGKQILPINDEKRAQIAKFDHHNYLNKDYGFNVYEKIINLEGLEKETTYRLEIQAVNPSGTNKWSQERNYTVFTTPNTALNLDRNSPHDYPPFQTIKPIVNVSANTDGGQTIEIKWLSPYLGGDQQGTLFRPPRPDVDYYNIRYRKNGTDDDWIVQTGIVGTPITDVAVINALNTQHVSEAWIKAQTHTLTLNLESGAEYRLEIQAHNSVGVNSWENYFRVFTTPTAPAETSTQIEPNPLSAEIGNLSVTRHDESPFTFDLTFSKHIPGLSFRTLRDHAFTVTNATIAGVRRLEPGKNQKWRVTVNPTNTAGVEIALPITADCQAAGAICDGDQPLSTTSAIIVPGPAPEPAPELETAASLTAEFQSMPVEHDGRTAFSLELHFSENVPGLSFRTLRDSAFTVTNGRVTGVRRLAQGSNRRWAVNVQPSAPETVTVHLPATADCAGAGAICLPDGRKLSSALAATILGPPAASVADATAHEGTDATLDFVVTLTRAPGSAVTVGYATSDATATAESDYTATRGTLTFAPGETTKTIPVPVLDDAIDEGEETMTLTLSIPSGVKLGDGEAVGTISNSDPLQKMWLSRFGRTAAGHVVDAVSDRLSGPLEGAQVTVGGQSLDFANPVKEQMENVLAGVARTAQAERFPSGRELLLGSAFHLASEGGSGAPGYAAWGRVTMGGFDGEEVSGAVTTRIDGDVTTGIVGADAAWERWLAGLAVSMSSAEGTFGQSGGLADGGRGTVESSLTSVQPYARVEVNERLSAWGLLGWGTGEMTMTEAAHGEKLETVTRTDIDMRLGAAGVRGALLEADEAGGMDLVVKADAFLVETQWDKVSNEADTSAGSSRLRLTLEGSRTFEVGEGKVFEPGVELGLRHDGGDAETGTGVELGARLRYADAASGLSIEASARTLLAHEASGFEEWGASGSIRLDPGASGRGLSFSLAPTLGAASSATQRLWSMADARGLGARDEGFEAEAVLNAEVGYGLGVAGGRFTGTPYAKLGLSGSGRDYSLGWRLVPAGIAHSFALNLEGTRNENADGPPAHGLMLRGVLR